MGLRRRLFVYSLPLVLLVIAAVWGLSQTILIKRFDQLDAQQLEDSANQLHRGWQQEMLHLALLSRDWAWWDDSYEFVKHPSQTFIERNFHEDTLSTLNLNFILYYDHQGKLVQSLWSKPPGEALPKQPDFAVMQTQTLSAVTTQGLSTWRKKPEDTRSSLFSIEGTPVLATSTPITNSTFDGEPAGTLVMGFFATPARLREMQERLLQPFELKPAAVLQAPSATLKGNSPIAGLSAWLGPRTVTEQRQLIDLTLLTLNNQPALTLHLSRERPIYQEGRQLINLFFAGILAILLVACLLGYLIIERWLIGRLLRMNQQISVIGQDSPANRLHEHGKDELAQLAAEINLMLERIEQGEFRDRAILNNIQDGYFEIDRHGLLQIANPALESMLGAESGALINHPMLDFLDAETAKQTIELYQQTEARNGQQTITAAIKRLDGSTGVFESRLSEIRQTDGELLGYRGIVRDVSNQVALHNQLLNMAYSDSLTGLGNRKAFQEQLASEWHIASTNQQPIALFFIDLDRFKEVNDRFGHEVGDALLKCIAERLRSNLRGPDRLFRLGGDEFTLLMPGGTAKTAMLLAERLLATLHAPIELEQQTIDFVGLSIGIALYPDHASSPEDLLSMADQAMYQAKQQRGRACLFARPAQA